MTTLFLYLLTLLSGYGIYDSFSKVLDLSKAQELSSIQKMKNLQTEALKRFQDFPVSDKEKVEMAPIGVFLNLMKGNFSELQHEFDFEGNKPLEESKIILFSERHGSSDIVQKNFQLLNALAKPGDIVLFEDSDKQIGVFKHIFDKVMRLSFPMLPALSDASKMSEIFEFCDRYKDFFHPEELPFNQLEGLGWDLKLPDADSPHFSFLFNALFEIISQHNAHLENRNALFEVMFAKLKCRRIFVIAGANHLPSEYSYRSDKIKESLDKMKATLEPYAYTIITKKDFKDTESLGDPDPMLYWFGSVTTFAGCVVMMAISKIPNGDFGIRLKHTIPVLLAYFLGSGQIKKEATIDHLDSYCPNQVIADDSVKSP